jgi:hypothetical protein
VNENWKPKIEHWRPAIDDYLDLWECQMPTSIPCFTRCQIDPVLRGDYLRLEASLGGWGWERSSEPCWLGPS